MNKKIMIFALASLMLASCGLRDPERDAALTIKERTDISAAEESAAPDGGADYGITVNTFELTSADLVDGVWSDDITDTQYGTNSSPQLKWASVEGAQLYSIYMVDTTAGNWLHWKTGEVTETELAHGWAERDDYVGPYPPDGTHTYEVFVFALKQPADKYEGQFNSSNASLEDMFASVDTAGGERGNIISYGHISGTYTAK